MNTCNDEGQKAQIKEAIMRHLDAERKLNGSGKKVISIFLVDKVNNYINYNEEDDPKKGKLATWFEECFEDLIDSPFYSDVRSSAYGNLEEYGIKDVYTAYFAQGKDGRCKDTKGNSAADDDVDGKIVLAKDMLLDQGHPTRFIFSHASLIGRWDDIGVFQICALNDKNTALS